MGGQLGGTGSSQIVNQEPFVFQVSTTGGGAILKSLNLTSIFAPDHECGEVTGLAFDTTTGTLWVSPYIGCLSGFISNTCSFGVAYQIDTSGNLIRRIQFPFALSGVAVAGDRLFVSERCDSSRVVQGFGFIDQVAPDGKVIFSFPMAQVNVKSWLESIAFDPTTFSTCAIWAMQPYFGKGSFANIVDNADIVAYGIPC